MPCFVPDTSMLAVMPIHQDFCFSGYMAAVPLFEPPGPNLKESSLAAPHYYSTIDYGTDFPVEFVVDVQMKIQRGGVFNAIGLLTNNFLAFVLSEGKAVQWLMNELVLPILKPLDVAVGDCVSIRFGYRAGCSLEDLQETVSAEMVSHETASVSKMPLTNAA